MLVSRLVIVKFRGLEPPKWTNDLVTGMTPEVRVFGKADDRDTVHVILESFVQLNESLVGDEDGRILVPDAIRKKLEIALELAANTVSVALGVPRSLRSPTPCVFLRPESQADREALAKFKGISCQPGATVCSRPRIDPVILRGLLASRSDGICLMAEALAQRHASGQFHEFFRVFERAFRTDCEKLIVPLSAFLSTGLCGYTKEEISHWVRLRGPLTHADRRPEFYMERDLRRVIARLEQAAVDVLVNKKNWRDTSPDREWRWRQPSGSSDSESGVFVTQGQSNEVRFAILDDFGVYPRDLTVSFKTPPNGAWYGSLNEHD